VVTFRSPLVLRTGDRSTSTIIRNQEWAPLRLSNESSTARRWRLWARGVSWPPAADRAGLTTPSDHLEETPPELPGYKTGRQVKFFA
jgi:hypothetical protein